MTDDKVYQVHRIYPNDLDYPTKLKKIYRALI